MKTAVISAAALAAALGSAPANAVIVNIAANDDVGVEVSVAPGVYLLKWIGIADGGLYDAAGGVALIPGGPTGFSNAFVSRGLDFGDSDFFIDTFSSGSVYGSAAASLAAYKAGNGLTHNVFHFVSGVPSLTETNPIPNPWITELIDPEPSRLVVLDADGTRTNNTGGVSLSIELIRSVPEPATWAMMIAGFGMVGAAMRRKQKVVTSFAF